MRCPEPGLGQVPWGLQGVIAGQLEEQLTDRSKEVTSDNLLKGKAPNLNSSR